MNFEMHICNEMKEVYPLTTGNNSVVLLGARLMNRCDCLAHCINLYRFNVELFEHLFIQILIKSYGLGLSIESNLSHEVTIIIEI